MTLRLFWWRHSDPTILNFGDELSPLIVEMVSGRRVSWAPIDECDLVALGSVLQLARQSTRTAPLMVWGSGFLRWGRRVEDSRFVVKAVRGPLTARRLSIDSPVALGDPGLLCSDLLRTRPLKRYAVGVVAHYADAGHRVVEAITDGRVTVIDPLLPPLEVIERIAECDTVLSSSLHGMITADSFGIPNAWLRLSRRVKGRGFKFRDHLVATGASDAKPYRVGRQPIDRSAADRIAETWNRPRIADLREGLVKAFPD